MIQVVEVLKTDNKSLETESKEILRAIQNKVEQFTEKVKKKYPEKIICQSLQYLYILPIKKHYAFFYYKEGAEDPFAVFKIDVKKVEADNFNKDKENRYIYY